MSSPITSDTPDHEPGLQRRRRVRAIRWLREEAAFSELSEKGELDVGDAGMAGRRLIGMSGAFGVLTAVSFIGGCSGGSDAGSGGAPSASGGAPASGGLSGGSPGSGGASSGAGPSAGGSSSGGNSSGGSGEAVGGQGGVHVNDPTCPAELPTHEGECLVTPVAVCSYEGTNCACVSLKWDCVGCPSEFVLALHGEDCSGYEGEECRGCECPTGPEPKWNCLGDYWQTSACAPEAGTIQIVHDGENGCQIVALTTDSTLCLGAVTGGGYCVQRVSLSEGVGCHEVTAGDGPIWRAEAVTGTLAVTGDEAAPIVSLDLTIQYDPASAWGEPPLNDMIQVNSCAADCSSEGCQ